MSTSFREWAKNLKMPHTLVIVGGLVVLVLVLSWIVPSGRFQREERPLGMPHNFVLSVSDQQGNTLDQAWTVDAFAEKLPASSFQCKPVRDGELAIESVPPTVVRLGESYTYGVDVRPAGSSTLVLRKAPKGAVLQGSLITWTPTKEQVSGQVRKVPVPGTFQTIPKQRLGLQNLLLSPIKGFLDGSLLIAFLLIIGGCFNILQETGAVEFGIKRLVRTIRTRPALEWMLIPVLMLIFSLAGAIFGMAEETIPFIVIFIPMARALGYDSMVGMCIPFLGSAAGFACAFINPFTVGVAQGIAGVPMYSGLKYRFGAWVLVTSVVIAYVMAYAHKVKKNPEASIVRDIDQEREKIEHHPDQNETWDLRHVLVLQVFVAALVLLVFGVLRLKWDIDAIAALFLGMGIVMGLLSRMDLSQMAKFFITGAKDMVGVVFIVACARALLVIANEAQIMDTILFYGSNVIRILPKAITAQVMFFVQCVINFFIHSGTAQAALTMPIMAPLSELVGITRQTCVYSFELCELLVPILPTSAVAMGVLGAAKIPYERWAKFFLPLMLILVVMACLLLVPPTLLFYWGPI